MTTLPPPSAADAAATLAPLSPAYAQTPLLALPRLAARLGVAEVLVKDEGKRLFGSFKPLGGVYAGLRALARAAGTDVATLLARRPAGLPALVCASDGNHGLAVAAAARFAGAPAKVFLHAGVPDIRARRIAAEGATLARVAGNYDDSVDAAAREARASGALLIDDTSDDPDDPVVADVMAGYGVIAAEIRAEVEAKGAPHPTHLFIQAGVGGIAAAMAEGFAGWLAAPARIVVADPARSASIVAALAAGKPVRLAGALETSAEMLSCGEASAPALRALMRRGAEAAAVEESALAAAPTALAACGGPATTPSGAAGIAAALALVESGAAARFCLEATSRVLFVVTEAPPPGAD